MYTSRVCPACKMDRFPDEKVVAEKKHKYVIYKCRCCGHQDIERLAANAKKPLWDARWGKFDEGTDDTGLEEESGP